MKGLSNQLGSTLTGGVNLDLPHLHLHQLLVQLSVGLLKFTQLPELVVGTNVVEVSVHMW